jgi:signal transduction histidine kinase
MRLWSAHSISARLTGLVLFVSGTALLLAYISFLAYDFYTLRNNLIESLETQAAIIGTNSESALLFDDQQSAETTLSALRGAPTIVSAEIFSADGRAFARYTRRGPANRALVPRLQAGESTAYWIQDGTVILGHSITSDGKPIGTVYIQAETSDVAHRARQFGLLSAGILLLCFVIALIATTAMRGVIVGPLQGLAEVARIVSRKKDYSVRAEIPKRRDELAFLVQSFNEMLDEIEQSREVLEQRVAERTVELSAANRELEAFSYTVAHDLRGPLQHVSNIGFLLQLQATAGGASEQTALLEKLVAATTRMSSLIDDLLNLSRAASAPIQHVRVDMSALARSILETLAQGSERQIERVVAADCAADADEGLITILLENLLRNAWKYTSRKNPAHIEFGCRDEGEETIYFVRDNGAGFDNAYAERLFIPFQRLHSQADFPGTGVGLATVQRIVARHGGRIWATGQVDRGAEFCFTLPHKPNGEKTGALGLFQRSQGNLHTDS